MLQITLCDDGRGIDLERLRAKVVERGLAAEAMAEQLSEAELLEFLFLPGFSTKEEVTEISGRGVGLDVVQSMVQAVGGTVRVSSQLGKGTRFTLHLPITLSVIRALLVRIARRAVRLPAEPDRPDPESSRGPTCGSWRAASTSRWTASRSAWSRRPRSSSCPPPRSPDDDLPVVVVSDRGHRFGLVVDGFLGEHDLRGPAARPPAGQGARTSAAPRSSRTAGRS